MTWKPHWSERHRHRRRPVQNTNGDHDMQRYLIHNGTATNEPDQNKPRREPAKPARKEFLMTNEAADFLRLSARTLERMRVEGTGPRLHFCWTAPPTRKPARASRAPLVLYRQSDLEDWLAGYSFASTPKYDGRR